MGQASDPPATVLRLKPVVFASNVTNSVNGFVH
jgi:hypothetical protein